MPYIVDEKGVIIEAKFKFLQKIPLISNMFNTIAPGVKALIFSQNADEKQRAYNYFVNCLNRRHIVIGEVDHTFKRFISSSIKDDDEETEEDDDENFEESMQKEQENIERRSRVLVEKDFFYMIQDQAALYQKSSLGKDINFIAFLTKNAPELLHLGRWIGIICPKLLIQFQENNPFEIWTTCKENPNIILSLNAKRMTFYNQNWKIATEDGGTEYAQFSITIDGMVKKVQMHNQMVCAFYSHFINYEIVNHYDGDSQNNKLINLESTTYKYNSYHCIYVSKRLSLIHI